MMPKPIWPPWGEPETMPDRLETALRALEWGPEALARGARVNIKTARRWTTRAKPVPEPVQEWLDRLAAFHIANPPPPPPADWGQGIDIETLDL